MRWTDLEEFDGRLGINVKQKKTGLEIWVPFTAPLLATISTWERRPGFILLKEDGHPFTRQQLSDQWLRERDTRPLLAPLRDAGLVIHGLRGTAVVRLRRAGATIPQISDMVGMSPQMVTRYCRYSVQRENALAAVYMLDRSRPGRGRMGAALAPYQVMPPASPTPARSPPDRSSATLDRKAHNQARPHRQRSASPSRQ